MALQDNKPHAPHSAVLDPVDAVLRQDSAWGPDDIDMSLWLSTVNIPICLVSGGRMRLLKSEDEVISDLRETERRARAAGVASLRTLILSHIQPAENLSIIASIRQHLDREGQVISATSVTWNVVDLDGRWRISQLVMENSLYDLRHGD